MRVPARERGSLRRRMGWLVLLLAGAGVLAFSAGLLPGDEPSFDAAGATSPVIPNAPTDGETAEATEAPIAGEQTVFQSVVDGDTIRTDAGTVRLIGIDTPERGECGHAAASAEIRLALAAGDAVTLVRPPGQTDTDRYGRLIRHAFGPHGEDIAYGQLVKGHAVARYDSSDGYPSHDKETDYRAAQTATVSADGKVIAAACAESGARAQGEGPNPEGPNTWTSGTDTLAVPDSWWETYPSCSALKRNTAGHPKGPFASGTWAEAEIYEWFANGTGHRGDGDMDGLACE